MKRYIDLSVTVDNTTLSPPSTNMRLDITPHRRGPGFWQVSSVTAARQSRAWRSGSVYRHAHVSNACAASKRRGSSPAIKP